LHGLDVFDCAKIAKFSGLMEFRLDICSIFDNFAKVKNKPK